MENGTEFPSHLMGKCRGLLIHRKTFEMTRGTSNTPSDAFIEKSVKNIASIPERKACVPVTPKQGKRKREMAEALRITQSRMGVLFEIKNDPVGLSLTDCLHMRVHE